MNRGTGVLMQVMAPMVMMTSIHYTTEKDSVNLIVSLSLNLLITIDTEHLDGSTFYVLNI